MVETCELRMNEIKQNCQILQNEFHLQYAKRVKKYTSYEIKDRFMKYIIIALINSMAINDKSKNFLGLNRTNKSEIIS
jgi:hypothetical protein